MRSQPGIQKLFRKIKASRRYREVLILRIYNFFDVELASRWSSFRTYFDIENLMLAHVKETKVDLQNLR